MKELRDSASPCEKYNLLPFVADVRETVKKSGITAQKQTAMGRCRIVSKHRRLIERNPHQWYMANFRSCNRDSHEARRRPGPDWYGKRLFDLFPV